MKRFGLVFALLTLAVPALGAPLDLPIFSSKPAGGGQEFSLSVEFFLLFTLLSFLPSLLLMMTSFTRIVIVLSLLRHALGVQTTPPNQVLIGLALFLTFFVMSPVFNKIYEAAWQPYSARQIALPEALDRAQQPLKAFMLRQTRESDIALFAKHARITLPETPEAIPLQVLVPAFVISELKTAFQIGFLIFLPFIIIDMVVASILMAMGMMMMSPMMVSLPFKLMLFVLVDGWALLIDSLIMSFGM